MRRHPGKFRPLKKPSFYCDEDFPKPSLSKFRGFKIKHSVLDYGFQGREDQFHFQFAFEQKAILLTLDEDYLDNKRFKPSQTFGLVVLKTGEYPTWERVNQVVEKLKPMLKSLTEQSLKFTKLSVSLEGYVKSYLKDNRIIKEEIVWRDLGRKNVV